MKKACCYFPLELPPSFVGFCGCLAPQPSFIGFPPDELLLRRNIGILPFFEFEDLQVASLDFFDGWIIFALKSNDVPEQVVQKRYFEPLVLLIKTSGIYRVVVCFGIYSSHNRRFIGHDSSEPRVRLRDIPFSRLSNYLKIGQRLIVVVLKNLVCAGPAAKIKRQLKRADHRGKTSKVDNFDTPRFQDVSHGCRAEDDYCKIEPTRQCLAPSALGGMIQRITKRVKDEALGVVSQFQSPFMSSSSSFGGFGWLGPQPRFSVPSNELDFSTILIQQSLLSCVRRKVCSGSRVRGAARVQTIEAAKVLSTGGCPTWLPLTRFHPAYSSPWVGMIARGGEATLPRATEHALGRPDADHHGTAEQQDSTDNRPRRDCEGHMVAGKCSHRGAGRRQRRAFPSLPAIQQRAG